MILEVFEAARNFADAFNVSVAADNAAIAATQAFSHQRRMLKLLLESFSIQETICLDLDSQTCLICHFDCEGGFTHFSQSKYFQIEHDGNDRSFPTHYQELMMTTTTSPIELSKREYIATHLLAATIVEDRIAWAKNFEGNTDKELIRHAIRLTDGLLEQLESL